MSKNLFITGTGTDIGKTYLTGLILKKLRESGASAAYFKAAMSGSSRDKEGSLTAGDSVKIKEMSKINQNIDEMCPYIYETAVSPHLAAHIENNPVNMEIILKKFKNLCDKYEYITVEGSGGVICPIRMDGEEIWLTDIIKTLGLGCLIVADAGLGTINSVGLTSFYMKQNNIPIKGIIFNNFDPENIMHRDNIKMCEYLTKEKVIAAVKKDDNDIDISIELLKSLYTEG